MGWGEPAVLQWGLGVSPGGHPGNRRGVHHLSASRCHPGSLLSSTLGPPIVSWSAARELSPAQSDRIPPRIKPFRSLTECKALNAAGGALQDRVRAEAVSAHPGPVSEVLPVAGGSCILQRCLDGHCPHSLGNTESLYKDWPWGARALLPSMVHCPELPRDPCETTPSPCFPHWFLLRALLW